MISFSQIFLFVMKTVALSWKLSSDVQERFRGIDLTTERLAWCPLAE